MQTNPTQAAIDLCIALGIPDHHAPTIQAAFAEREEKAGFERRNIISHATMGNTTGEGMSVNDICVEISRQRNKLYQAGKDEGAEREARLVGALAKGGFMMTEPHNIGEHRARKLVIGFQNGSDADLAMEAVAIAIKAYRDAT